MTTTAKPRCEVCNTIIRTMRNGKLYVRKDARFCGTPCRNKWHKEHGKPRTRVGRAGLRIATEGCCAGHACDDCERCLAGDCCGEDVVEANLPLEGTWDGKIHGDIGILAIDSDQRLQCHICGRYYENLGQHVNTHGVNSERYRAYFGLNVSTPLCSERLCDSRSFMGKQALERGNLKHFVKGASPATLATPEQRSTWALNREARAERRREREGWMTPEHQAAAGSSKSGKTHEERQGLYRAKLRKLD